MISSPKEKIRCLINLNPDRYVFLDITGYSGEVLEDELGGLRLAGPGLPADHDALVLPAKGSDILK